DDRDAVFGRLVLQLFASRRPETVRDGQDGHIGLLGFLQIFINSADRQRVILGGLEYPFLYRIGNFAAGGAGNQGDLLFFNYRDHRHGLAGRTWSDDGNDLVVLDQLGCQLHGLGRIAGRIIRHQFEFAPLYSAGLVDLVNNHLGAVALRFTQESGGTGNGKERADLDRGGGKYGGREQQGSRCNDETHDFKVHRHFSL